MAGSALSVLHVLPTFNPRYGGPVAVATGMCRSLADCGVETTLVSGEGVVDPGGYSPDQFDRENRGGWGYGFSTSLMSFFRERIRGCDVVHIHGLWNFPATMAALQARKERVPYILTPHGMLTPWSLSQSRVKKALYVRVEQKNVRGASALHFFTPEESARSERWGSNAPVMVVPNGVPRAEYDRVKERNRLECQFPVLRGKVVILFLGRLHPGKGLDILIPAFSGLISRRPDCVLAICGPDAEFGMEVERLVESLGLEESVLRTGLVVGETRTAFLGGSDIFVLPSRHEGDSMAAKEAMQAGLPVVLTPQCGFGEAIEADAGISVAPEIDELALVMERLAGTPSLRESMGSRGKQLIESAYLWDRIAPRLIEAYECLGGRRTPGVFGGDFDTLPRNGI